MSKTISPDPPKSRTCPTVLFLDNSHTFGGAIISLARLVNGIDSLGVRSVVVSGQPRSTMEDLFGEHHSLVASAPIPRSHETHVQRLLESLDRPESIVGRFAHQVKNLDWLLTWTLPNTLRYISLALRHRASLIHLNNGLESQLPGLFAAKLLGIPCVAHTRYFSEFSTLVDRVAGSVDRHIAVSSSVKQQLVENGVRAERISVVHNPVDVEEFSRPKDTDAVRKELNIPPEAKVFGLVGRIMGWKGVKEFVSAAIRVLDSVEDAYALIVGDESDGNRSYFREVQNLAQNSSGKDRIIFAGFRDDVPAVLQTLDLLVHTSVKPEPFGRVLAEAMAAGTPVVASNRGGPLDIVIDGETGLLVDPEDTATLATTIELMLRNSQTAQEMGERGRQRAKREFAVNRHATKINDIYRSVLPPGE